MEFNAWLESKKIDPIAFRTGDPSRYQGWAEAFGQMHPASFAARYLYQINPIRRKFTLRPTASAPEATVAKPRPVIRPKTT